MKYFYKFSITTLIIILALVSCKKSITEPEEKTLIGKWSFSSVVFEHILTTNSNQVAKLPYSGNGSNIVVTGSINTILNGLVASGPEPLKIYVLHIEYDSYIEDALTIDDETKIGTFIAGLTEQTFIGPVDYSFNGTKLIVNEATLINQDDASDTINLNGEISFETKNIPANTPIAIEIPSVQIQYPRGYIVFEFFEDNTFSQTTNYSDGSVTSLGTYELSGNTVTATITEGNQTDTRTIEYSIENNILTAVENYNLCDSNQDISQCLNYYEGLYGLEASCLISATMESMMRFREVNDAS